MANFFDDDNEQPIVQQEETKETDIPETENETNYPEEDIDEYNTQDIANSIEETEESGISATAFNNPNDVEVTISDKKTPIVVLFGPPACGKTMTLVRLSRYLNCLPGDYKVKPVRSFRPDYDKNYKDMCDDFSQKLNASIAAEANSRMNFMLVSVSRNAGEQICQILEGPGELYFDPNNPDSRVDATVYFNKITSSPNRKVYVIILEPNWRNETDRRNYVERIRHLKKHMSPRDRVILLGNKVDKADEFIQGNGFVNKNRFRQYISDQYVGLLGIFKETRPIISFFKPYDCEFVPFKSGTFCEDGSNKMRFTEDSDKYPENLWKTILKRVGR